MSPQHQYTNKIPLTHTQEQLQSRREYVCMSFGMFLRYAR